jgi:predicted dehydrogenase
MQRREFLQTSLACGAGFVHAAANRSPAAEAAGSDDLNVALIGAGIQGRVLINAAVNIPGLRFRAICDPWDYSRRTVRYQLERYEHQVNQYADYREMLDKESGLDAVLIATPDFVHAEQAVASLQAGRHVYCERPMAHTAEAARTMAETARQTGRLLQIGYQHRSNPRYQFVRQRLLGEARLLGRVVYVRGQTYQPISEDVGWPRRYEMPAAELQPFGYDDMHQLRNWRSFQQFSAGPLAEFCGCHMDAVAWLLDAGPQSVTAVASQDYYTARQWYDHVTALVAYRQGDDTLQGQFQVLTMTSGDGHRSYQHLMGTDASLRMSENAAWTAVYREPHAPDWETWVGSGLLKRPEIKTPPTSAEEHVRETGVVVPYRLPVVLDQPSHQPHLENFFAAIQGQADLTCPADAALATELLVHRAYDAAAKGKTIALDS